MRTLVSSLVMVCALVSPALADPQFTTLERADRESRLGVQAGLLLFDSPEDAIGLRTEVYAQLAGALRGGGTIGGYVHLPLGFVWFDNDDDDDLSGVGDLELGGYYVMALSRRTDLTFHLGLSLPTASDDYPGPVALDRNYDVITSFRDTTALNLGVTLRTALGASAFLQADFALDLAIKQPGENVAFFHANLGIGAYVGSSIILMGELATAFADDDETIGFLGSLSLGIRFRGAAHPHIAYTYGFADDDGGFGDFNAHILSFGFYASL